MSGEVQYSDAEVYKGLDIKEKSPVELPSTEAYKGIGINTYQRGKEVDAKHLSDTFNTYIKAGFSITLVIISLALFGFGAYTAWNHKDAKVRETAVSLMGIPAGLVAGLLGGIGLR